jgi:hypothetical protein
MADLPDLPDPRAWPSPGDASPAAAALYARVEARLAERETRAAEARDAAIDAALMRIVDAGDGRTLAGLLDGAPSAAAHRHLRRRVGEVEAASLRGATLAVALFAIPVVIVAARDGDGEAVTLPATLASREAIADLLREHDALRGNAQFAVSQALVGVESLDVAALPGLVAHGRAALEGGATAPLALAPKAMRVEGTGEGVHLRFLVGSALCGPHAEPFDAQEGKWSLPLARALSRDLAHPGVTLLALPRPPQRLVPAVAAGLAAQRDIALQLFVGNALRRMRARTGEPVAVLSAHCAPDAPGGGELRLALSSPFAPREAEGFRYALQRYERVPDAVTSIETLLRDCRVADVRGVAGVLPDRDAVTGILHFARADDAAPAGGLH